MRLRRIPRAPAAGIRAQLVRGEAGFNSEDKGCWAWQTLCMTWP